MKDPEVRRAVLAAIRVRAAARADAQAAGRDVLVDQVRLAPDSMREVDETSGLLVLECDVEFTHPALPDGRVGFRRRTSLDHWWPGPMETVEDVARDGLNLLLVDADEDGNDRVWAAVDR